MEVGDYVRLVRRNITYIRKINSIYLKRMGGKKVNEIIVDKPFDYIYTINDDKILKSSPNIIDLLVKDDLVVDNYGNVYKVDHIKNGYIYTTASILFNTETKYGELIKPLLANQIKQILTHEEFEERAYKVGE